MKSTVKITAITNGPLLVEGQPDFVDEDGEVCVSQIAKRFALCRCGGSSRKPFCDGSHVRNGFVSAPKPQVEALNIVQPTSERLSGNVRESSHSRALADWESDGGSQR